MSNARLLKITLEQFKSFKAATTLELKPLTVILGRNNCGKSSLIQALLLLKQTLNNPRPDVSIGLEGIIDAFNLRELTHGWPKEAKHIPGPCFTLEWESIVHQKEVKDKVRFDLDETINRTGLKRLIEFKDLQPLRTKIKLYSAEVEGVSRINKIELWSDHASDQENNLPPPISDAPLLVLEDADGVWNCRWQGELATKLVVAVQHFIPYLQIDRRNIGPRNRERSWHNVYLLLFDQPLADLSRILSELHFLGSSRQAPAPLNKFATTAPNEIGVSGELAGQLLQKRQKEHVHFLPPLQIDSQSGNISIGDTVKSSPMGEAVNEVMQSLAVDAKLRIDEIKDVGFRIMFGDASLVHVGRGLNSLLPLIELGLFADPIRFSGGPESMSLLDYRERCRSFSHIALEEPEAHLHPKVASRLAHWLVSLAMTNRCMMVETHSDHLVRRLRGLAARAKIGSELESWLLNNVSIVMVEQNDGCSTIQVSHLTKEGDVQNKWPSDFMDESTDEESAIYYAKLDKKDEPPKVDIKFDEGAEPELEKEP
jgi:energy-coupling factor transporter ATP-binding protein EcfA2